MFIKITIYNQNKLKLVLEANHIGENSENMKLLAVN